jgi:arsenate reductase-like glutaredoxin family protein
VRTLLPGVTERNYASKPLTADEVRAIVAAAGGVAAVLNGRHERAKTGGWKEAPPPVETFVAATVADANLLRRPIVLADDGRVVVGKDEAGWRGLAR